MSRTTGVNPMSLSKNISAARPRRPIDQTDDNTEFRYASKGYQKVLDYHVAEILLSTIVLAIIALLRLHH
jgi:hypothetical protein